MEENNNNFIKNSEEIAEFGNFTYILYKFNPIHKKVQINIDGGRAKFVLSKDEFYKFIKEACNDNIAMELRNSTSYWDTYFLYNRQTNSNKMISLRGDKNNHRFTREEIIEMNYTPSKENFIESLTSQFDKTYRGLRSLKLN